MAYRTRILDRMMPDIGFSLYATYYYHIVFADKTNIPVFISRTFAPPQEDKQILTTIPVRPALP